MIYYTPIWDVLAPQGEQEQALIGLRTCSRCPVFPIRQVVPVGLAWARFCSWAHWAPFFIEKKRYCSIYNTFTYNLLFYQCWGR
jgi:hypothetical protein